MHASTQDRIDPIVECPNVPCIMQEIVAQHVALQQIQYHRLRAQRQEGFHFSFAHI